MKERLQELREKFRDAVQKVLEKTGPVARRVVPVASFFGKKSVFFLGLPVMLASFVGLGIFLIYPAYELKPWLVRKIVQELKAEKVSVGELKWDHSFLFFSLGVQAEDVRIDGASWIEQAQADSMRISIRPLELLRSGSPFNISIEGMEAKLSPRNPNQFNEEIEKQIEVPQEHSKMVEVLKNVLSDLEGYKLKVNNSELSMPLYPRKEILTLKNISMDASTGISLKQDIRMNAFVDLNSVDGKWGVAGPIYLDAESVLVRENGVPKAIEFNRFDLDLSKASFSALGVVERIGGSQLRVAATPRITIENQGEGVGVEAVEMSSAVLRYDDLKVGFNLLYLPQKEWDLEWIIGRSEVTDLRLPIVGLRRSPGKGIITSHGRIILRDSYERSEAKWHLILNNFRMEAESIASMFGDSRSVRGELKISAITEGSLRAGLLETARTELQVDADKVQIEFPNGHFVKPEGSPLGFLLRVKKFGRELDIEDITFNLHTLKANLRGKIDRPFVYLFDDLPGEYDIDFRTNNVDLSEWSGFFPSFRKVPLQGFVEIVTSFKGALDPNKTSLLDDMRWSVDKFHLSNVKGSIDSELGSRLNLAGYQDEVAGPFALTLYFTGRGMASKVRRARLLAQADFTEATVWVDKYIRKPADVPLQLQLSLDQSQNRVDFEKGYFSFADMKMNFSGKMIQGSSGSRMNVSLEEEVDLEKWREFLIDESLSKSLTGKWWLNGAFSLDSGLNMEKDIDWKTLIFEGQVKMSDLSWDSQFLRQRVNGMDGRVDLLRDSLQVKEFSFREGDKIYSLDGSLQPKFENNKKKKVVYLHEWLQTEDWDARGSITVPSFDVATMLSPGNTKGEFGFPKSWYKSSFLRNSSFDLNLIVDNLFWSEKPLGSKFFAKAKLDDGRFRLEPMSIRRNGGLLKGEYTLDFNPVWNRSASPLQSANISFSDLPAEELQVPIGLEGSRLSGSISGTSEGHFLSDWKESLKAKIRFSANSPKSLWVSRLAPIVDEFFAHPKSRDYLLSDGKKAACQMIPKKVLFEGTYKDGSLDVERMRHELQSGGRLDLAAKFNRGPNGIYSGSGKAAYVFPPLCLSARAQSCMVSVNKQGYVPLGFRANPISQLGYEYELGQLAAGFGACMEAKIAKEIAEKLKN